MSAPAFHYARAAGVSDALVRGARPGAAFLAGGTDLIPLWKAGVQAPERVIDISRLPLRGVSVTDGLLSIGALTPLSVVAAHVDVARHQPLIAEAILASACGQVRNMATVGGNLLQRTRCSYFRSEGFACNKRAPGSGCSALAGENRQAALFGASQACVATHPSDLAVVLSALDAQVEILGPAGARRVGLSDFFCLPGATPERDTSLAHGELIAAVHLQDLKQTFAGTARRSASRTATLSTSRSTYLKVRDRAAFEFAVVSVAAVLRLDDGVIIEARLAAGGVAPVPWRMGASEAALIGRPPDADTFAAAAALAVEGAVPLADNAFKVELLQRAVARALQTVAGQS